MPSTTFKNLNAKKQARVMAALLTEFSNHSLADAQVARIVTAAGIARGAFYKYFDDLTDAYQTVYHEALAAVHRDVETTPSGVFTPATYYNAVVAFVDQFTNSQYDELIRRHYSENESLLPDHPVPVTLPAADWSAMVLSHATIKEIMLRPANRDAALTRFQQALQLLAE
ncbi:MULTISPECIES: TetR/AcrR family transcriptional regulator [Levilactobacillus]|uniref:TetR/AcrR family transcriptional regulator n=1 Tax=Levilactobacillus TaxID=2767886 RepID=UPI00194E558C|nr:TetR/AcrR family transcriptional regulator [Levilactobacillus sp. 244-2]